MFVRTDDVFSLNSLSQVLCGLNLGQAVQLVGVLGENVDVDVLVEHVEYLYDRAKIFSFFDLIGDFGDFFGVVLDMPSLRPYHEDIPCAHSKIPCILHLDWWFHDLDDCIETIVDHKKHDHFDWTV